MKSTNNEEPGGYRKSLFWWMALAVAGLVVYTVVMFAIEASTSQEFARNFFSDIQGALPFYGINTSISVFLLWATALLFTINHCYLEKMEQNRTIARFYLSQVAIFGYLGLDDRFRIHERIGWLLDIGDYYVLIVVGMGQALVILLWGRAILQERNTFRYFCLGAVMSAAMLAVDAVVPGKMFLRLSIEDLLKTWGAFFFFLYGWAAMHARLGARCSRESA